MAKIVTTPVEQTSFHITNFLRGHFSVLVAYQKPTLHFKGFELDLVSLEGLTFALIVLGNLYCIIRKTRKSSVL